MNRRGAHRARLTGREHLTAAQVDRAERRRGPLNRDHFRVRGRVTAMPHFVVAFGDQRSVAHNDRAERRLSGLNSGLSLFDRAAHPGFMVHSRIVAG